MNHTSELLLEAKKNILFTANRPEIVMDYGEGMYLWDTEGNKYLDFIGGWAVNCLGHSPKAIQNALVKQSRKLVNASPTFLNKSMIEFAKLLTENSCFDRVFFASSGADEMVQKLTKTFDSVLLK